MSSERVDILKQTLDYITYILEPKKEKTIKPISEKKEGRSLFNRKLEDKTNVLILEIEEAVYDNRLTAYDALKMVDDLRLLILRTGNAGENNV